MIFGIILYLKTKYKILILSTSFGKINNEIVGFAGATIIFDNADITNIVTKKNYRNYGIGKKMFTELLNYCKEKKCSTITLEVKESNITAISLYSLFGFKKIGIRKNYYKNENGILMQLTTNYH